jgi:o-succinylbenzoate synthase
MRWRLDIVAYRRRLDTPMTMPGGSLADRRGWLVSLRDADGTRGLGEVAPIYWIDDEPLAHVRQALDGIARDHEPIGDVHGITPWLADLEARIELPACVRAGLETAALDMLARRRGQSVAKLLGANEHREVPISLLLSAADPAGLEREVATHAGRGVRAFKLKVGAATPRRDLERIESALRAIPRDGTLRLDANRAWPRDVACEVLSRIPAGAIDYVEEPLRDPDVSALAQLRARVTCGIAIDESIDVLGGVAGIKGHDACDVIVVKPARVGGPLAAMRIAREAQAGGMRCVLTDALETGVGQAAVVHAAAALPGGREAVGVGGRMLADDLDTIGMASLDPRCAWATPCGPGLDVRASPIPPSAGARP